MDELTLVARLRKDLPDGVDLTAAQARLADEIAAAAVAGAAYGAAAERLANGPRAERVARGPAAAPAEHAARGRRGAGRRLTMVGAVAAAAAAIAAAVFIAQGQPGHPTRGASGPPRPSTAPVPGPAATAAQLVAYATRAAAAGPPFDPQPHQWVYTEVLQASSSAGGGGYLFGPPNERVKEKSWQRVDGLEVAYLEHGKLVISPTSLPRPAHGKVTYIAATPFGWPNASYPYLESLPTDPGRLMAVIRANVRDEPNPLGSDGEGNVGVFNAIQALMQNVVLPPKLLAGLYGVLARDPAVRFDRSVTDIAGRTGVGFYTVQEGYLKEEIVINPRTYAYMGYQDVAIRAHTSVGTDMTSHFHKGQILGWEARLASGIVRHPGQLP
jgi:hypothetical protein